MLIWINEIPAILHDLVLSKKGNNRKNKSILDKNNISVKAGKVI